MAKKVLFTSHTANFSKFNRPFMRMLKGRGFEVHYASAGEEEVLDCDRHFTVPFERSPLGLNNLRAFYQLKKIIDTEKYDLIHTHTPMGSVVTRLAARSARKAGTKVIYTAHGFHFFKGASLFSWLIYFPIEKFMSRYTDTLITINQEDYSRANDYFDTRVRYVPGVGIDSRRFAIRMSDDHRLKLRMTLNLAPNDFILLYIAELNDNKNQAMLLRVLAGLRRDGRRVKLLLAGFDSLNGKLQAMAEKMGVGDDVRFLGYRNDIPLLINIADLAVSASRREGLPVNIMEAMQAGLPVVLTACRGNSDLVENGKNGIVVKQNDDEGFKDAILRLYADANLRSAFGKASRKIIQEYSLERVNDRMREIYDIGEAQKKKALFVHDFKYVEFKSKAYGEGQFEYKLWKQKYLSFFDEITVAARGSKVVKKNEINGKYRLDGAGVRFVSTDSLASLKRLLNTSSVKAILNDAIDESDIVIVRLPSIQGLIACSLLEKKKKPYIVEVVGSAFDSLWYHDRLKGKILAPILHLFNWYHIKQAPNAIYVTDNFLQSVYPNKNNFIACSDVIINGMDEEALNKRLARIKEGRSTFKVGLVGSYGVMYKGHDIAIKAIAQLSHKHNIELHFLGSGPKDQWMKIAKTYGIESAVYFDAPLNSGSEMYSWLDEMDILMVPSKTEGMPRVLLEGMSRASVIVASHVGDIPHVLNNKDVIDKKNWAGFAKRIDQLLSSKAEMTRVAKRNFRSSEKFTLDKLSKKRDSFIRELLKRQGL